MNIILIKEYLILFQFLLFLRFIKDLLHKHKSRHMVLKSIINTSCVLYSPVIESLVYDFLFKILKG